MAEFLETVTPPELDQQCTLWRFLQSRCFIPANLQFDGPRRGIQANVLPADQLRRAAASFVFIGKRYLLPCVRRRHSCADRGDGDVSKPSLRCRYGAEYLSEL